MKLFYLFYLFRLSFGEAYTGIRNHYIQSYIIVLLKEILKNLKNYNLKKTYKLFLSLFKVEYLKLNYAIVNEEDALLKKFGKNFLR